MTEPNSTRVPVAILGSGNIGTDLMYKLLRNPGALDIMTAAAREVGEQFARQLQAAQTQPFAGVNA